MGGVICTLLHTFVTEIEYEIIKSYFLLSYQ